MAQPANTFSTYDSVGNREDLSDIIYDISPEDTPFLSAIPKVGAESTYHEWQTEALASVDTSNARIEGNDAVTTAPSPTVRVGNYCQISDKVPRVTGTQRKVKTAGRSDEFDKQVMKMGKELKRDIEAILLTNNAQVAGNDTTAREAGSVLSYIATNDSLGGSGASPTGDGSDARTDGTQRAFTEALLQDVLEDIWTAGGDPDMIMVGAHNKKALSAFTGNATRNVDSQDKRLVNTIDLYEGDFGQMKVVANRFMRSRDALVVQSDMWALAELRPFQEHDLSKTGDSDRKQLLCEYTLEARNEAASGLVADLSTS